MLTYSNKPFVLPAISKSANRLEAQPIRRILDRQSRELVGWIYEWNTGEHLPKWKDGKRTDVIYE